LLLAPFQSFAFYVLILPFILKPDLQNSQPSNLPNIFLLSLLSVKAGWRRLMASGQMMLPGFHYACFTSGQEVLFNYLNAWLRKLNLIHKHHLHTELLASQTSLFSNPDQQKEEAMEYQCSPCPGFLGQELDVL
jgi:hypothetical protein